MDERLSPSVYHTLPSPSSRTENIFTFPKPGDAADVSPAVRSSLDVTPDIVISPPPKSPETRRRAAVGQGRHESPVRGSVPFMGGEQSFSLAYAAVSTGRSGGRGLCSLEYNDACFADWGFDQLSAQIGTQSQLKTVAP